MKGFKNKLYRALFFLILIVVIGIAGYMFLADYNFVEALYMTVITVTTVGFGEVHPLNQEAKIFTIFLILTSITIFGYAVSMFSEYLASGQFLHHLKLKKVQKTINSLKGHTIVCGYGRNGKQAIKTLKNYNQQFVVIERNKDLVEALDIDGVLTVNGDSTIDETLLKAGIKTASNLITTLPSDADNLFVVLSAKQLNNNCKIISRASKESSYSKLKIAGANNVIMPDKLGGAHMASLVVTPDVVEFVDRLTLEGDGNAIANLREISVNDLPKRFLNKSIVDLDLRRKTGCNVIGFKTPENEYIINPEATYKLVENSHLILLGRPEQIAKLKNCFS